MKCLGLMLGIGGWRSTVNAQQGRLAEAYVSKVHIGLGVGMEYGGIGPRVEFLPVKYVGLFAGAGYNFQSLGANVGIALRPLPDCKIQPIAMAMYGYNGVIKIDGNTQTLAFIGLDGVSKTYYGFSAGLGGEWKVGSRGNRLYAAVWRPFRSEEFETNYDKVQDSPYITNKGKVLPVTFSFGFNWAL